MAMRQAGTVVIGTIALLFDAWNVTAEVALCSLPALIANTFKFIDQNARPEYIRKLANTVAILTFALGFVLRCVQ